MGKASKVKDQDSSGVVTVACKLPNGLILRVFDMAEDHEPVLGGGSRKVSKAVPREDTYAVHGSAKPFNQEVDWQIIGGYGLTPNIPREFYDKWEEQNASAAYVKNALVFAYERMENCVSAAKDHKEVLSGMQPLTPNTDSRLPKSGRGEVGKLETAEKV